MDIITLLKTPGIAENIFANLDELDKLHWLHSGIYNENELEHVRDVMDFIPENSFARTSFNSYRDEDLKTFINVCGWKNITNLSLYNNRLTKLPDEIKYLLNLETLDLSYNYFTTFPEVLYNLPNLKNLILLHTEITDIPSIVRKISKGIYEFHR